MKHLFLVLVVFLVGCVQQPESAEQNLHALDNLEEESYTVISDLPMIEGVEVDNLTIPQDRFQTDTCFCEWQSWEERGLMCVGVVCSESCPLSYSECREVRRACIVRR